MQAIALFVSAVGRLNAFVGKTFSWLALAAVLVCFTVVVQRYLFSTTQLWMQDLYVWLNGAMFMAVAGYTLLIDGHVRVDISTARPAGAARRSST
jgi:TRAP-type mannitol/chloroaromatic compound transport system permease small subunit